MRKYRKKNKVKTSGDIYNSIIKEVSQTIGESSLKRVDELILEYGSLRYDEGWEARKDYENERPWYE